MKDDASKTQCRECMKKHIDISCSWAESEQSDTCHDQADANKDNRHVDRVKSHDRYDTANRYSEPADGSNDSGSGSDGLGESVFFA